jgi:hypothetical protein
VIHHVPVIAAPVVGPLGDVRRLTMAPGTSVAAIAAEAFPALPPERLRVTIRDELVPHAMWARVRPHAGTVVVVRAVAGNDNLATVLQVAVVVAAVAISAGALGPAGLAIGGTLFAGGSISASLLAAGVSIAGAYLVNALVPAREENNRRGSPTAALQGWNNQANFNGVIPRVLGTHRFAPPYAAMPYTQVPGQNAGSQTMTAAFLFGYGPVQIDDIRVGETPIDDLSDITYEVRQGFDGDLPMTLYTEQVREERVATDLTQNLVVTRTTAQETTAIEVEVVFPAGLYGLNEDGNFINASWACRIRYRLAGGASGWIAGPTVALAQATENTRWVAFRWAVPRGRYDVEIMRTTADTSSSDRTQKRSQWTVLRSWTPEYPIAAGDPLALLACTVRTSGQLGGRLDQLNALCTSICPDYDAATGTWINRATNNPASLFRHVLQSRANAYPIPDDGIDLAALAEWHVYCDAQGLTYNRVHDGEESLLEVLTDVAAAGRATPLDAGDTWTVVVDRPKTLVAAHITPRNAWGFEGTRSYGRLPDGFRVKFRDETAGYEAAERVIPFPDVDDADVVITEDIQFPGVTDPTQVWREARRRQHELLLRRDTYTVSQDFEAMSVQRGDLVALSHDVLDRTMASARVIAVAGNSVSIDAEIAMDATTSYAARFRAADGTSYLRSLITVEGASRGLVLTGSGIVPQPGELVMIGAASRVTFEAVVKSVEVSDRLTCRLTLVDHAPELEGLVDDEAPPVWGYPEVTLEELPDAPLMPTIVSVTFGTPSGGFVPVIVTLAPAAESMAVASYEVDHREEFLDPPSFGAWATVTGAGPTITISGIYASGDTVNVLARAVGLRGSESPDTAITTATVP